MRSEEGTKELQWGKGKPKRLKVRAEMQMLLTIIESFLKRMLLKEHLTELEIIYISL